MCRTYVEVGKGRAVSAVDRRRHVTSRADDLTRTFGYRGRRHLQRHAAGKNGFLPQRHLQHHTNGKDTEEPPRKRGAEPFARRGRGHHFRRRCFARRERRRERIAAGQRRRHCQAPTRAAPRILLEAAQDHALHRRIEVPAELRRRRRCLVRAVCVRAPPSVAPLNARLPVNISYSTSPSE